MFTQSLDARASTIASLDLAAYLERIEWGDDIRLDLDTLSGLLAAHVSHIPFENLDILARRPVHLDLDRLQDKLVRAGRGGYCFEHATLFAAVLMKLGFVPVRHSAHVTIPAPLGESPRTHMFLTVKIPEGTFVVDPGFCAFAPRVPIQLVHRSLANGTEGESHWMERKGHLWLLRARLNGTSAEAWVSTLRQESSENFEIGNYFASTHSGSPFVNRIILRALTADGRVTLMNRELTISHGNVVHTTQLTDRRELRALLIEHFGFDLPAVERLRVPSIPEWQ
jgi:N-hydroxyarylamine O-acetyltransferase